MQTNNSGFKYETLYKVPFEITQCQSNGAVTLQCGATKIRYTIRQS